MTDSIPTQIIVNAQSPDDRRDEASGQLTYIVQPSAKMSPLQLARLMDSGQVAKLLAAGAIKPATHNSPGLSPAAGHRAAIVYPSGRVRSVGEYD